MSLQNKYYYYGKPEPKPEYQTNWTIISQRTEDRTDPPADEWPYPDEYVTYLITGQLAEDVRKAFGNETEAAVVIDETCISGGYSEYTQENEYEFTVRCGNNSQHFNSLGVFMKWVMNNE